jgi:hypothetical protein
MLLLLLLLVIVIVEGGSVVVRVFLCAATVPTYVPYGSCFLVVLLLGVQREILSCFVLHSENTYYVDRVHCRYQSSVPGTLY